MMTKLIRKLLVAAGVAVLGVGSAFANIQSFDVTWSGQSFGNSAAATGSITFDDALLAGLGFPTDLNVPSVAAVSSLSITISGSSAGNGTFGRGDFSTIYFTAPAPLNLSQQLIGQALGNGCTFGTSVGGACGDGFSGDFNLLAPSGSAAPSGTWYFTLTTAGGDAMLVTSMVPVPESEIYVLMLAGLGLVGAMARSRKGLVR